jgi:hypothetical protein
MTPEERAKLDAYKARKAQEAEAVKAAEREKLKAYKEAKKAEEAEVEQVAPPKVAAPVSKPVAKPVTSPTSFAPKEATRIEFPSLLTQPGFTPGVDVETYIPRATNAPTIKDGRVVPADPTYWMSPTFKEYASARAKAEELARRPGSILVDPDEVDFIEKRIEKIEAQPLTAQGGPGLLGNLVGAYAPTYPYKGFLDTPSYTDLAQFDERNQALLGAQGAGFLSPLAPQVLDPVYAKRVKDFVDARTQITDLLAVDSPDTFQYLALADQYEQSGYPALATAFKSVVAGRGPESDLAIAEALKELDGYDPRLQTLARAVKGDGEQGVVENIARQGAGAVIEQAAKLPGLIQPEVEGKLVEAPVMTALRWLNTPWAVVGGALEGVATGIATDKTIGESVSGAVGRYVREGRGLADAVSTISGNLSEDVGAGQRLTDEVTATMYIVGLAADIFGPAKVGTLLKAGRKALAPAKVATLAEVAINAPKGLVPGAKAVVSAEAVKEPIESAALKLRTRPEVETLTEAIIKNPTRKIEINDLGNAVEGLEDLDIVTVTKEGDRFVRNLGGEYSLPAIRSELPKFDAEIQAVMRGEPASPELAAAVRGVVARRASAKNLARALVTPTPENTIGVFQSLSQELVRITPDTFVPRATAQRILDSARTNPQLESLARGLRSNSVDEADRAFAKSLGVDQVETLGDYNKVFEAYLRSAARAAPTWVAADDIGRAITDAAKKGIASKVAAETLSQRLFTAPELAGGTIVNVSKVLGRELAGRTNVNPVVTEVLEGIKNELAGLDTQFGMALKRVGAADKTLTPSGRFIKTLSADADPNQIFDDYIRLIYGSHDYVDEIIASPTGKVSMGVDAATAREAAAAILDSGVLNEVRAKFKALIAAGQTDEAIKLLRETHEELAMRKAGTVWTMTDDVAFRNKHGAAPRGLVGDARPVYGQQDVAKLLVLGWTERRMKARLTELLNEARTRYPTLFDFNKERLDRFRADLRSYLKNRDRVVIQQDLIEDVPGESATVLNTSKPMTDLIDSLDPQIIEALAKLDAQDLLTARVNAKLGIKSNATRLEAALRELVKESEWLDLGWVLRDGTPQYTNISLSNPPKVTPRLLQILADPKVEEGIDALNLIQAPTSVEDAMSKGLRSWDYPVSAATKDVVDSITGRQGIIDLKGLAAASRDIDVALTSTLTEPKTAAEVLSRLANSGQREKLLKSIDVKQMSEHLETLLVGGVLEADELVNLGAALKTIVARTREAGFTNLPARKTPTVAERAATAIGNTVDRSANWARSGALGGLVVPNMVYHATNIMTAPLIVLQNLGLRSAFDLDAVKVLKQMIAPSPDGGQVLKLGDRLYNMNDLTDIVARTSLTRSQAGADFVRSFYDDMLVEAGLTAEGNAAKLNWFKKNFSPGERPNFWAKAADTTDLFFRTSVLTKALKEGRSLDESAKMAREALFDYGSVSAFERKYLARFIWFYSFWSRNLINTAKNVVTNPGRIVAVDKLSGRTGKGEDLDTVRDPYGNTKWFSQLVEDAESGAPYALVGPDLPAKQALEELVDLGSIFLSTGGVFSDSPISETETMAGDVAWYFMSKGGPQVQLLTGLLADKKTDGKKLTIYPNPKLIQWLNSTGLDGAAQDWLMIEPVPAEERKLAQSARDLDYESRGGEQWRVRPGYEKRWFLFEQALLNTGLKRNLTDTVQTLRDQGIMQEGQGGYAIESRVNRGESALRTLGVLRAAPTPSLTDIVETNEANRVRSIENMRK